MEHIVVTGAGGYIGGRLLEYLLDRGCPVLPVTRRHVSYVDSSQLVVRLESPSALPELVSAFRGASAIVHLAGDNEVTAGEAPARSLSDTVSATHNVAAACTAAAVRRMVYVSTVHVYGARTQPGVVLREDMRPEPRSSYAIARLASEHAAQAEADRAGFELVTLRLTNAVGAPASSLVERWSLVVNDLCRQGASRGRLTLKTPGQQWRDFTAVGDVCSALFDAAADATIPPGTYNLAAGRMLTIRQVAELVQETIAGLAGTRPQLEAPPATQPAPESYSVSAVRWNKVATPLGDHVGAAVAETAQFCLEHFRS